jgi:hypothetical protein
MHWGVPPTKARVSREAASRNERARIRPRSHRGRHRGVGVRRGGCVPRRALGDHRASCTGWRLPLDGLRTVQGAHRIGTPGARHAARRPARSRARRPQPRLLRSDAPHARRARRDRAPRRSRTLPQDGHRRPLRLRPVRVQGHRRRGGGRPHPFEALRARHRGAPDRTADSGAHRGRLPGPSYGVRDRRVATAHRCGRRWSDRSRDGSGLLAARCQRGRRGGDGPGSAS